MNGIPIVPSTSPSHSHSLHKQALAIPQISLRRSPPPPLTSLDILVQKAARPIRGWAAVLRSRRAQERDLTTSPPDHLPSSQGPSVPRTTTAPRDYRGRTAPTSRTRPPLPTLREEIQHLAATASQPVTTTGKNTSPPSPHSQIFAIFHPMERRAPENPRRSGHGLEEPEVALTSIHGDFVPVSHVATRSRTRESPTSRSRSLSPRKRLPHQKVSIHVNLTENQMDNITTA